MKSILGDLTTDLSDEEPESPNHAKPNQALKPPQDSSTFSRFGRRKSDLEYDEDQSGVIVPSSSNLSLNSLGEQGDMQAFLPRSPLRCTKKDMLNHMSKVFDLDPTIHARIIAIEEKKIQAEDKV